MNNDFSHCDHATSSRSTCKDISRQCSDPFPFSKNENRSGASDVRIGKARSYTEEEIMLASSHPKKPTGRKKFKETRHPVYRGVRRRNANKWVCEVKEPNKKNRIWLGTYPTAEMAARAHDVAALALRGGKSCLNFADSAWRLPVPVSTNAEDIQRAAAEAAEMFKPEEFEEENLNKGNIISDDVSAEDNNNVNNVNEQLNGENMNNNVNSDNNDIYGSNWRSGEAADQQEQICYYRDDEDVFNMPGLLNSMAEGQLLPPPPLPPSYMLDGDQDSADMTLWDHSF